MKKQLKKISLLALLSQSSWGQEQHLMLWKTAHKTTQTTIPGLSLEIFSSIETRGEKPEIEQTQCIRVDASDWSLSQEIKGDLFFPDFKGSYLPLAINIQSPVPFYNFHVSADYTAVPYGDNFDIHQSLLYKGVVQKDTALTVLIPLHIAKDLNSESGSLKFLGLSLWPTQCQVKSTFMDGAWTLATDFDEQVKRSLAYLKIAPAIKDLSPKGLTIAINLEDGSLAVNPITE